MIGVRVVTHSVVLPRTAPRRRRVTPRSNPTGTSLRIAPVAQSGLNGVKHRRPVGRARPIAVVPAWPGMPRSGWKARFDDDRDLTAIKAALIAVALLIAMALEVPW